MMTPFEINRIGYRALNEFKGSGASWAIIFSPFSYVAPLLDYL